MTGIDFTIDLTSRTSGISMSTQKSSKKLTMAVGCLKCDISTDAFHVLLVNGVHHNKAAVTGHNLHFRLANTTTTMLITTNIMLANFITIVYLH
jgi:hypothetical protein